MKRILYLLLLSIGVFLRCGERIHKVAIVTFVSHPDIQQCIKGIEDALKEEGFESGKNIKIEKFNAEADTAKLVEIAKNLEGHYSLIIILTTPALEEVSRRVFRTPCVFGAVSYPLGVRGIGESYETHRENITGVGTPPVVKKTIKYMLSFINPKTIGIIWTPKEVNAWLEREEVKRLSKSLKFKLITKMVTSPQEVTKMTEELFSENIGGIYMLHDNTVMSKLDEIIKMADKERKPVVGPTALSVEKGSILGIGADYYKVGKKVGVMAAKVLKGTPPKDIPIIDYAPEMMWVNKTKAEKFGIKLPSSLLKNAVKVF